MFEIIHLSLGLCVWDCVNLYVCNSLCVYICVFLCPSQTPSLEQPSSPSFDHVFRCYEINNNLFVRALSSTGIVCFWNLHDSKVVNHWPAVMLLIPVIFWIISLVISKSVVFLHSMNFLPEIFLTMYTVLLFVGTKILLPSAMNYHGFRSPLENMLFINCAPSSICFLSNGSALSRVQPFK